VSLHERRRRLRLHRLEQTLDDLEEESFVKEQNFKIAQQSHGALTHKLSRYQQLQVIAEQLSQLVDLQAIAQLAVQRAFGLIGKSDACLLFLVDKDRQELSLVASEKGGEIAIHTKQGDQFDRYVLRTQRPLLVNDVMRDFRFSHSGASERSVRSVMACPVRVAQNASGVMRLDSHEAGTYTQDDLRFLDILLDLVDAAIANARLFAQTQQLALTDGLTGLYRRQALMDQLGREVARATRARESLSVLMLDIDDFKKYNDTFGHTAGDVVLKAVAEAVRGHTPPDAMCGRYGGEEFAVVLPKSDRAEAERVAEAVRDAVARGVHRVGEGAGRVVTVSIGVAVFPEDAAASMELIRRADQRLYQAKRSGKNRLWSS
jgi:diguanylate cyclase (GGDEF)-like protein